MLTPPSPPTAETDGSTGPAGAASADRSTGSTGIVSASTSASTSASASAFASTDGSTDGSARGADAGEPQAPAPADRAGRLRLPRHARKIWLIAHVAVSVGWLGLTLGILTLGLTGKFSGDAPTARAAYLAMRVFADWLLIPVSLLSLVTGVVLALGTPWGLLRYRWVVIKFWLTLAATLASIFALRTFIHDAAGAVAAGDARPSGQTQHILVVAPSVALTIYLFATILSILKPWGPTKRGIRLAGLRNRAATGDVRRPGPAR